VAGLEILNGMRNQGVCGTEVPQRGPGAEPRWGSGDPEADDIIWKMTIANIVSRDHCIKILAEWMD